MILREATGGKKKPKPILIFTGKVVLVHGLAYLSSAPVELARHVWGFTQ
jgi:hypothetical protein